MLNQTVHRFSSRRRRYATSKYRWDMRRGPFFFDLKKFPKIVKFFSFQLIALAEHELLQL
jgi:hypothetical protein